MKYLFILAVLLPIGLQAQYNYTFKDLSGKWIEQTRTDKNNDVVPFKDTLFVEIRETGFMLVRHTIGATSFGDAQLVDNTISIEKEKFTIESQSEKLLKLKQGKYTHRFVRFEEFTDAPVTKVIPGKEEGTVKTSFATLQGKWTVYKKTDPNFDKKYFYIKNLNLKNSTGISSFTGNADFHNMDSLYNTEIRVNVNGEDIEIISKEKSIKAHILKSDGEELILENGAITYFMKRFGK